MADQETGKQRKSRIPLDYFKRPDVLVRWKLRITLLIVILTVGLWCAALLRGGDRLGCSRGPVAAVHATWETTCTACHEPFAPINTKSWAPALFGVSMSSDDKCSACHAGPRHHKSEDAQDTPGCAGCHRDHRGRDASLVRMPDENCTRCHADLKNHGKAVAGVAGPVAFANRVTGFNTDHPEFRFIEKKEPDPGKLKFNHALHMTEGLAQAKDGAPIFMLDQVAKGDQGRYHGGVVNPQAVQLKCTSCHQLDSHDFGLPLENRHAAGLHTTRTSGSTMLPIKYENQCRPCHPLTIRAEMPVVPHGLQPPDVRKILDGSYMRQYLEQNPQVLNEHVAQRPMPGRVVEEKRQAGREELESKVAQAEKILYAGKQTCGECHSFQAKPNSSAPEAVIPTTVNDVWFEHAGFDHAAHRAVSCLECHEGATKSKNSEDVLIPAIQTCRKCHGPVVQ